MGGAALDARLFQDAVGFLGRIEGLPVAVLRMKEAEREIVRVVVVGDPAPHQDVRHGMLLSLQVVGHRGRHDRDLDPELAPHAEERRRERAESVLKDGVDRGLQPDGKGQPRLSQEAPGGLSREERAPPPRVVAQDAGRQETRGGKREAPERPPDEILAPRHPCEGAPERGVRAERTPAATVEQDEVRSLLRRLDEARRGSAARAAAPRGRAGGGRGPARPARRGGPRRWPRRSSRRGSRCRRGGAAAASTCAGSSPARPGPARAARSGRVPFRGRSRRSHRPRRA